MTALPPCSGFSPISPPGTQIPEDLWGLPSSLPCQRLISQAPIWACFRHPQTRMYIKPTCTRPNSLSIITQVNPGPMPPCHVDTYMQVMCAHVDFSAHPCPHVYICVYQVNTHAHTHSCLETLCLLVCSPITAVSVLSTPLNQQVEGRNEYLYFPDRLEVQKGTGTCPMILSSSRWDLGLPRAHLSLAWPDSLCSGLPSLLCRAHRIWDRGLVFSERPSCLLSPRQGS